MFFKTRAKKKYIWSALTLTLAGVVIVGTVLSTTQTALARPTLPGVEKIIQNNSNENPFVILEIVPDTKDASLGFFVDGEEPVDDSGRSIKDMPGATERAARFLAITATDKISSLGITSALSYQEYKEADQGASSVDIRGVFENVGESGDYKETDASVLYSELTIADEEQLKEINKSGITLFRKYTSFRIPEKGAGEGEHTYKIQLKELEDTEIMPIKFEDGTYNEQYFVAEEITSADMLAGELEKGDLIFAVANDGSLLYVGMLESGDVSEVIEAESTTEEETTDEAATDDGATEESTTEENTNEEESTQEETTQETTAEEPESTDEEPSAGETVSTEEVVSTEETSVVDENTSEENLNSDLTLGASMIGKMQRMSISLDKLDFDSGVTYVRVVEADGDDNGPYYYISEVEATGGDMSAVISFGEVLRPSGGYPSSYVGKTFYTLNDNSLPYDYDPLTGTFRFVADYTQDVYDTVSYDGGFTNEEWFKKYVFDLDDDELSDMSIDVVPVAMADLTQELLDKADLIYFSDTEDSGFQMTEEETSVSVPDGKWMTTFDFDDESGGFSTTEAKAEKKGDPVLVDRDGGKALYLDGSDDYLNVTSAGGGSLLAGATELTVSFLMKPETTGNANWAFYAAADTGTQTHLAEKYLGIFENSQTIQAERYNNAGERPASASGTIETGAWTHVAVVFTETDTTLYLNGQKVSSEDSEYALTDILGDNGILQIGMANWGNGEYFQGWIDDYTIANYAMSSGDIKRMAKTENIYNAIVRKVSEGVPVALNRSLYTNEKNDVAVRKMAACLMHSDILEPFGSAGIDGKAIMSLSLEDLSSTMKQPLAETGSMTYVNGNIFVYDDDNKDNVVSENFHKEIFAESEIEYGFTDLIEEIQNENFYLEVAGKEERIEEKVTMATAIRYIINFGDRRNATKTTLRVLDIEPYDFEDYFDGSENPNTYKAYQDIKTSGSNSGITVQKIETDSICITEDGELDKKQWIIDNLAPQFADNRDDISVTIMGTKEFVGKLEDINAEYDLIYLGMDTSIMNTEIVTNKDRTKTKTDNTVYNDSDMNGLVYTHVGDEIPVSRNQGNGRKISGLYRLSGNDITSDKLRELTEYIEAGYAVILSDEFLKISGTSYRVDTDKVDISSNMYKLVNDVILSKKDDGSYRYFGKNVNIKSEFEDTSANAASNREKLSRYMGISKLTLKYSSGDLPVAYNQEDGSQQYLSMDSDGIYRLKYKIELENDAAVEVTKTNYDCKLYVDIDADGRYEEDEALTGLDITDESGSEKLPDGNGKYHLGTGSTYRISRAIPEGYTGFLAWKLVFEQNDQEYENVSDRSLVRTSIEGYSAVPVSGTRPVIKVLQITSGSDTSTNLDLQSSSMTALYSAVNDFEIQVTKISAYHYLIRKGFGDKSHAEYLKEYDMVVMGFKDTYFYEKDTDNIVDEEIVEATLAIREYALSGRSILFTHDLNSFNISDDSEKRWGWYANRILRDVQGMDRFGVTTGYNLIPDEPEYEYISKYDKPTLQGETLSEDAKQALSNPLIIHRDYKENVTRNVYGENARRASWDYHFETIYNSGKDSSSRVSQVNTGQITEYPYKIDESFDTTLSHPQYMQLNLDTDSRDENDNDDIVVWYTLGKKTEWSDGYYAAVEMDVRNNYFIYNKGNVTYTGSGHQYVTSDMEMKLFVNTLVASYRTGMHAPRALYKENEWDTSATITSMYIPYDPEVNDGNGGFLDEALPVHFYTTNVNLQNTNELLYVKYYVDGTESDYTIKVDGRYYKEVTPTSAKRMVEENGALTAVEEEASRLTNNSMHTVTFSYSDIGLGDNTSIKDKYSTNIYVRLGYEELEAAGTDGETSLPATESISKLNIVCTQLFELR